MVRKSLEVRTRAPKREIAPDDIDDVVRGRDLFYGVCRDRWHWLIFRSFRILGDAKFRKRKDLANVQLISRATWWRVRVSGAAELENNKA